MMNWGKSIYLIKMNCTLDSRCMRPNPRKGKTSQRKIKDPLQLLLIRVSTAFLLKREGIVKTWSQNDSFEWNWSSLWVLLNDWRKSRDLHSKSSMKWVDWMESAVYRSNQIDSRVSRTGGTFIPYYTLWWRYGIDIDPFRIGISI